MGNRKSNINPASYEGGKVILVDPNPENREIVTPEDLSISVKLRTIKRERSSIVVDSSTDASIATVKTGDNGGVINFIGGSKTGDDRSLTTHYTELNTDFNKTNGDLETLGITGIKIDFNSSYAPLITINFTDIRGKLFEMGNDSPYSVFFNLPYPIFELTIKGYYGKAVTYCLHLTKFNGKLNDKTGNYEISTQFVGYTFAFLADMLMGYLRAVPYTPCGLDQIEKKNLETVTTANGVYTNTFFTFDELQDGILNLNIELLKLKHDDPKIAALALAENTIVSLETLKETIRDLLNNVTKDTKIIRTYGNFVISAKKPSGTTTQKVTNAENAFNRTIKLRISEINDTLTTKYQLNENTYKIINNQTKFNRVKQSDFGSNEYDAYILLMEEAQNVERQIPKLMDEKEEGADEYDKFKDFVKATPETNDEFVIYDMSRALDDLTEKITSLKNDTSATKEEVADEFGEVIADTLGKTDEYGDPILPFEPTVLNFFKILSDHVDIFMTCLRDLASSIELDPNKRKKDLEKVVGGLDIVKGDTNIENLKPWPDYKEKDDKVNGYVDKWIGNKAPTMPEVQFVEDMLSGLLKAKQRDNEFLNKLDLGFPNWYPVNPFDTSLFTSFENPWKSVEDKDDAEVIRLMLLRGITFIGFSHRGGLTDKEIRAMARIEANNAYTSIKNQEIKDSIRYYNEKNDVRDIVDEVVNEALFGKTEWKNYAKALNGNSILNKEYTTYTPQVAGFNVDISLFGYQIAGGTQTIRFHEYIYVPSFESYTTVDAAVQAQEDAKIFEPIWDKDEIAQFIPLYNPNNDNRLYGGGYLAVKSSEDAYWGDQSDNNTLVTNAERIKLRDDEGAIFFSNYLGGNGGGTDGREDDGSTWFEILDGFGNDSDYYRQPDLNFPSYGDRILEEEGLSRSPVATLENSYGFLWNSDNVSENTSVFGGLHKTHEFINAKVDGEYMVAGQTDIPAALMFYTNTTSGRPIFTGSRTLGVGGVKVAYSQYDIQFDSEIVNGEKVITKIYPDTRSTLSFGKIQACNRFDEQDSILTKRVSSNEDSELGANKSAIYQSLTDRVNVSTPFLGFKVYEQVPLTDEEDAFSSFGAFEHFSTFGSDLYYSQDNEYAKAYLFLHSIPFDGMAFNLEGTFGTLGNLFDSSNRANGLFSKSVQSFFNQRAGFIEIPHSWLLFLGAVIKRQWNSGIGGGEYVKFLDDTDGYSLIPYIPSDGPIPANNEYCLPDLATNEVFGFQNKQGGVGIIGGTTSDFTEVERTIRFLPWNIKRTLVDYFEDWVEDESTSLGWGAIRNELQLFNNSTTKLDRIDYWQTFRTRLSNDPLDLYTDPIVNPKAVFNYIVISKDEKHQDRSYLPGDGGQLITDVNLASTSTIASTVTKNANMGTPFNFFLEMRDESDAVNKMFDFLTATRICANASWRPWAMDAEVPVPGIRHPFRFDRDKLGTYVTGFIKEFIDLHTEDDSVDKDLKLKQELFQSINNDDIKLNIYKNLKSIHDKWIAGGISSCGVTRLIDHFKFIDRSYRDISDEFKVNPSNMMEYMVRDYNQSFYEYTARVLTDNNFDFIPLPSWVDYNSKKEIENVFNTYSYVDTPKSSGPQFICMYIGERSNKLDLGNQSQYDNDGFDFKIKDGGVDVSILPEDLTSPKSGDRSKVPVFLVKYSDPNQSVFKGFKLDQSEFTETDESLQVIDDIANKGGPNQASGVGQNLFDIYNTRSYSAEIEMMGNAQIQPLMYFQLSSVPMFHGAYTIIKVSHVIKPNTMSTTFKGVRIRHVKTKMVDDTTIFMNLIGSLTDVQFSSADLDDLSKSVDEDAGKGGVSNTQGGVRLSEHRNLTGTGGPGQPDWSGCITYPLKQGNGVKVQDKFKLNRALNGKKSGIISPYCLEEVGKYIEKVGSMWNSRSKNKTHGDTIWFNDLSLYGGGDIVGHSTHETGLSIDIRQVRVDKENKGVYVFSKYTSGSCPKPTTTTLHPKYDRAATIEFIELLLDEALVTNGFRDPNKQIVRIIYFNDPEVINHFKNYKGYNRNMVKESCGHHHHLHVEFNLPDRIADDEVNDYIICKEQLPVSPSTADDGMVGHLNDMPDILTSLGYQKGGIVHEMAMIIARKEGYGSKNEGNRPRRNNNPGNLVGTNFKDIDPNVSIEVASKPIFAKFSKKELGVQALTDKKIIQWANGGYPSTKTNGSSSNAKAFQNKYNVPQGVRGIGGSGKPMTIEQFMYTYAPPNENNTERYVKSVVDALNANGLGVNRTSVIKDYIT